VRIVSVETTPLAVPFATPYHWRSGNQLGANLVLFTVETDDGAVGYGESIGEDPAAIESYGRLMAERFVGRSPGDVEAVFGELWRDGRWRYHPRFSQQVLAGLEGACWDALGKALGVPASTFLGGRVRDEVDFFGFPQGETPEELARHAAGMDERVIYLKIGRPRLDDDEAAVAAVREAIGPERLLRVDANEAWDVPTAIAAIRVLERYDLDWVEQPVSADNVSGLAQVRRAVSTAIAADQAVFTRGELRAVLEAEAADAVVIGAHESGGLWRLRQLAALAEAHGVPLNRHGCIESALSSFASLQALAAIPNLTLGNQIMHQLLAESLVATPFDARVPDAPGLGCELDEDAVERAHERYAEQGPYRAVERTGGAAWR
jgi:L-alanine-DL-glutamate epimerase-like enolase superfamily enzyme